MQLWVYSIISDSLSVYRLNPSLYWYINGQTINYHQERKEENNNKKAIENIFIVTVFTKKITLKVKQKENKRKNNTDPT